jgi:hypothetical protein
MDLHINYTKVQSLVPKEHGYVVTESSLASGQGSFMMKQIVFSTFYGMTK